MVQGRYGYRYPGGHSVIDNGWQYDEETVPKKQSAIKPKKARTRKSASADTLILPKGTRVKHATLGTGTVLSTTEKQILVKFDTANSPQRLGLKTAKLHLKVLPGVKGSTSGFGDQIHSFEKDSLHESDMQHGEEERKQLEKQIVGCFVNDAANGDGIITGVMNGHVTIVGLDADKQWTRRYPHALLNENLQIIEEPNSALISKRQRRVKDLIEHMRVENDPR